MLRDPLDRQGGYEPVRDELVRLLDRMFNRDLIRVIRLGSICSPRFDRRTLQPVGRPANQCS